MKTITFGEDKTTINIGQLEACPDFCGIEITKGSYLGEKYLLSYNGIEFSFCGGRVDQDSRWANNVDWKTLFNIMNKDGREDSNFRHPTRNVRMVFGKTMKTVLEKSSVTDIPTIIKESKSHWLAVKGYNEKYILTDYEGGIAFVNLNGDVRAISDTVENLLKEVVDTSNTTLYSFDTYQERHNWLVK